VLFLKIYLHNAYVPCFDLQEVDLVKDDIKIIDIWHPYAHSCQWIRSKVYSIMVSLWCFCVSVFSNGVHLWLWSSNNMQLTQLMVRKILLETSMRWYLTAIFVSSYLYVTLLNNVTSLFHLSFLICFSLFCKGIFKFQVLMTSNIGIVIVMTYYFLVEQWLQLRKWRGRWRHNK
jgi:hypothetical protein